MKKYISFLIIFQKTHNIWQKNNEKEYDSNENDLLYDWKFLNGRRHGKEKEYNKEMNLVFEGEFSNGKRNGIGKEYNDYKELIFDGNYIYGKKI